jgi:hypothetical protein
MRIFQELITSDGGRMSLAVLVAMTFIGLYIVWLVMKNIREDVARQGRGK